MGGWLPLWSGRSGGILWWSFFFASYSSVDILLKQAFCKVNERNVLIEEFGDTGLAGAIHCETSCSR